MYLEMLLWPAVLRIIKEIWFKYLFLIIILLYGLIKFNTQINSPNYSINPFIHYYSIITDNKSINSW
ncbi:hypothetical protein FACS1894137_12320 [Spirochaetia bacterium]|nr:hypothetical protein FACS1894137_12320 [Spirochaetia bacterium]